MAKNGSILVVLVLLLSAFTRIDYNDLKMGVPIGQVVRRFGEPYSVTSLGGERFEYTYVERFSMNNELVYENHYILTVVNKQVVDKRVKTNTRPLYDSLYQPNPYYPQYP